VPEWEQLRDLASHIKEHTLSNLAHYLDMFGAMHIILVDNGKRERVPNRKPASPHASLMLVTALSPVCGDDLFDSNRTVIMMPAFDVLRYRRSGGAIRSVQPWLTRASTGTRGCMATSRRLICPARSRAAPP